MRGLAFPSNVSFERERSYEYGTPMSNVDDIPIDPALGGFSVHTALIAEGSKMNVEQVLRETQPMTTLELENNYSRVHQYSEGPQGDPFAPQAVPYIPIQPEEPVPPPKPIKRKRRVRREEECGFCQGDDTKNKEGEPEPMVTCSECGRSGHPSCMELTDIGDHMRSYDWKCLECKNCEICREKGDDERILFCDWCDRGWHLDCMNPPMPEAPEGKWHCPLCPPVLPDMQYYYVQPDIPAVGIPQDPQPQSYPTPSIRESSVASTSRLVLQDPPHAQSKKDKASGRNNGKSRTAVPTEDSEAEKVDIETVETSDMITPRTKRRSSRKGRVTERADAESDNEAQASSRRQLKRKRVDLSPTTPVPRVRLRLSLQKGKGKEREEDEPQGMFDDILSVEDRDTTKTTITNLDKVYFERSRTIAEEKLAPSLTPARPSEVPDTPIPGPSRPLRSTALHHTPIAHTPVPVALSASPGPSTPGGPVTKGDPAALRIRYIRFGQYDIKTWYDAPFPEEYASVPDGRMWICEFCLKYMKSRFGAVRHRMKCKSRHPPGDEIYRDSAVSIFEVDGRRNKIYCQNLCLLSKMFLDHKSLFYDVEPFLFYVITEVDEFGARFVGYFSKEKNSLKDYNVSCIMTLPVRQRQGWGNLLIDFSYLLSKVEQRTGSPEKPLSSLGALGYRNYWTLTIMRYLENAPDDVRLEDISAATSMTLEDICEALIQQNMIYIREPTPPPIKPSPGQSIKFPKGRKNGVMRRQLSRMQTQDKDPDAQKGPFIPPKHYEIRWDRNKVDIYLQTWRSKGYLQLRPEKLQWTPYLTSRVKSAGPVETSVKLPGWRVSDEASQPPSTSTALPEIQADDTIEESVVVASKIFDSPLAPEVEDLPETKSRATSPSKKGKNKELAAELEQDDDTAAHSLRGRSTQGSTATPSRDTPTQATRSKRRPPSRVSNKQVDMIEEDEALAARLALEEQRQRGRQLRSRTNELRPETNKTPPSAPSTPRVMPARKRRRIESPPEVEESAPTPETTTDNTLLTPTSPTSGMDAICEPVREINSTSDPVTTNGTNGTEVTDATVPDDVPPPEMEVIPLPFKPEPNHVTHNGYMDNVFSDLDVKTEEIGTPLTSGRQSIPSDDTVYAAEVIHLDINGKHPNGIPGVNGHAESDLRSTLMPMQAHKPLFELDEGDGDGDADADGEYEIDEEVIESY